MQEPFIGSEALATGAVTPYQLRSRYTAIFPGVYLAPDIELTSTRRARAAWLWSRRRGVVAGQSAAAMHRAKWIDHRQPAELLYPYRRPPKGIHTWSDCVASDETQLIRGIPITTPARTAFDIAGRYPLGKAVAAIDALARATRLNTAEAEMIAERYKGHRNIKRARQALKLVDPGAESPRETWLRLLVIEAGYPPPQTQIPIYGHYGELVGIVDMGWEKMRLALEYEGEHHRINPSVFNKDIIRHETMTTDLDWIVLRVTRQDTRGGILGRLGAAWSRRTCNEREKLANFSQGMHAGR